MSQFPTTSSRLHRQRPSSQREYPPAEEVDEPPLRRTRQRHRLEHHPEYTRERPTTGRVPTGKRQRDDHHLQTPSVPARVEIQIVTSDNEELPPHRQVAKRVVSASEQVISSVQQLTLRSGRLSSPVQLHALWHDAKRELAPQDREMNPAKVWVQAVDMCLSTSISLADGKYQAGNKIANYRGDMARKAKLHVQSYYGMTELSSPERALKVQWLLQKDRFTCPTDMREVVYIVQRIEIFY